MVVHTDQQLLHCVLFLLIGVKSLHTLDAGRVGRWPFICLLYFSLVFFPGSKRVFFSLSLPSQPGREDSGMGCLLGDE